MDYRRLSQEQLEQILREEPVDVVRRLAAKEEIERRQRPRRKPWNRGERIALWTLLVAVLSLAIAIITVPGFREALESAIGPAQNRESDVAPKQQSRDLPGAASPPSNPQSAPAPAPLAGLWAGTDRSGADHKEGPVYYRFLKGGKVQISRSLTDPSPLISPDIKWHLSGDQLLMERSDGTRVTDIYIGRVFQDQIIGESDRLETEFPDNLTKVSK